MVGALGTITLRKKERRKGEKERDLQKSRGGAFPGSETASAKALGLGRVWSFGETARRPVWLKRVNKGVEVR